MLLKPDDVIRYLLDKQIVQSADSVQVEELNGGVSGIVWKISGKERWVLKQALSRLKVKEEWHSDVRRILHEASVMTEISGLFPKDVIPQVLYTDPEAHAYLMTCAHEDAISWKSLLMGGAFQRETAYRAGVLLRQLHDGSRKFPEAVKRKLDGRVYFEELRVDPFHRHLIVKYPDLSRPIQGLIEELIEQQDCLVHGDFSPKNLLVNPDGSLVLLDFEAAHWGYFVFDLVFCMAHLLLKGWALKREKDAFALIQEYVKGYGRESVETTRLLPHLGLMLLARLDGKSPVTYVTESALRSKIRKTAVEWIVRGAEQTDPIIETGIALEG